MQLERRANLQTRYGREKLKKLTQIEVVYYLAMTKAVGKIDNTQD